MAGVVKLVTPEPPARTVPPVAAAYQSTVSPAGIVADIVTVPVPHLVKGPAPAVGAPGTGLIVAVTAVRVADTQPAVVFPSA